MNDYMSHDWQYNSLSILSSQPQDLHIVGRVLDWIRNFAHTDWVRRLTDTQNLFAAVRQLLRIDFLHCIFQGQIHRLPGTLQPVFQFPTRRGTIQIDFARVFAYSHLLFLHVKCGLGGCLTELCIQLAIIMIGKQAMNTILEMLMPIGYKWYNSVTVCVLMQMAPIGIGDSNFLKIITFTDSTWETQEPKFGETWWATMVTRSEIGWMGST